MGKVHLAASAYAIIIEWVFDIKVFADAHWPEGMSLVTTGDSKFVLMIDEDLDGTSLTACEAYLTTSGTGSTRIMIRNITNGNVDMLFNLIQIDSGELTSCTSFSSPSFNPANVGVSHCDLIAIDVDQRGTGCKGLGVKLTFS